MHILADVVFGRPIGSDAPESTLLVRVFLRRELAFEINCLRAVQDLRDASAAALFLYGNSARINFHLFRSRSADFLKVVQVIVNLP